MEFPDGRICDSQHSTSVAADNSTSTLTRFCLSRGQSIGLVLIAEAGLVSMLAVAYVLCIISYNVIKSFRLEKIRRRPLIAAPIDVLMLSLFAADFLQGMGAALDIKWIQEGKVEKGPFCTAQGVIQQLGETGVAMATLSIAIYTFIGIWWRKGLGREGIIAAKVVVVVAWIFVGLLTLLGNLKVAMKSHLSFEAPTPYWCWIGKSYTSMRLAGQYLWLWIAAGFSFVFYAVLYLWSRGIITRCDEDPWWIIRVHIRGTASSSPRGMPAMLAYPIVFCVLVLPLSVVRWLNKDNIPSSVTIAADAIYCLSGIANVILLLSTRPNSTLFGKTDWSRRFFVGNEEGGLPDTPSAHSVVQDVYPRVSDGDNESQPVHSLGKLPSIGGSDF